MPISSWDPSNLPQGESFSTGLLEPFLDVVVGL